MRSVTEKGFSLIEVIVSVAIFMGMTLVFTGMISQVNGQLVSTTRKLETIELKNALVATLSDQPVCSCLVAQFSDNFDSGNTESEANISELRSGCDSSASLIAAQDEVVPGAHTQLKVKSISIAEIRPTSLSDQYQGKLRVAFEDDKRTILFKSLEIDGFFTTDPASPASSKKIDSCVFGSTSLNPTLVAGDSFGHCPAGQYISGIDATGFHCGAPPANSPGSPGSGSASLSNPGDGCDGIGCTTYDYGPCEGIKCRTNGSFCKGSGCLATAPGASCDGINCCAGPHCETRWDDEDYE